MYPYSKSKFYSESKFLSTKYSERLVRSGGIFILNPKHSPSDNGIYWCSLPEEILQLVFEHLSIKDLAAASKTCSQWNSAAFSDYLWKNVFQMHFHQDPSIPLFPKAIGGWRGEFKRLFNEAPVMQCEILRGHRSYVLHVSFSNDGDMFTTCSYGAHVIVWSSDFPSEIIYQADLHRKYNWCMAGYSQFNSSDTLLMVSGSFSNLGNSIAGGEIAIFSVEDNFRLISRTKNKPFDLFGGWITDDYLVTGELKWLQNMKSTSTLFLTRSTQEVSSEHVPILSSLVRIFNNSSACIRAIVIANTPPAVYLPDKKVITATRDVSKGRNSFSFESTYYDITLNECENQELEQTDDDVDPHGRPLSTPSNLDNEGDRLLIFTTGDRTFTPHKIGIVRCSPYMPERLVVEHDITELIRRRDELRRRVMENPAVIVEDYDAVRQLCHPLDYEIEMDAYVVGMALSPSHRFLYINSHPWKDGDTVSLTTCPEVSADLDMHVFDLHSMTQVGCLSQVAEKFVPGDDSFYVFPSVNQFYIANGGRYKGCLYDRHYGVKVGDMPHDDAVSCVALSHCDPHIMVTVSDDKRVKVWRSRKVVNEKKITRATPSDLVQLKRSSTDHL